MPPKPPPANKKTEQKKKEKVIEDKTFGLKNKKGAKQQKFIQQVEKQVTQKDKAALRLDQQKAETKTKKQLEQEKLAELNQLFRPVAEMPKVGKDVDPKSVLCAFFKQGLCHKGDRCKWSHDLAVERKTEKRNVYFDNREAVEADTMDTWDDAKLSEVVEKKHGEKEKLKPKTDIICKYFLDALENSKYGWFWECPNGDSCIYRHALPPGYILKKDKKKLDDAAKEDQISLDELIEKERAALGSDLTKVTLNTFLAWKKRKIKEKKAKAAAEESKRRNEFKAGKQGGLSGRDLFTFNPDLVLQDDEEADDIVYRTEKDEDEPEMEAHEIDASLFMSLDGIDDELEDSNAQTNGGQACASASAYKINEDLFNPDEIPDSDEEEEESEGDGEGEESSDDTENDAQAEDRPGSSGAVTARLKELSVKPANGSSAERSS